MWHLYKCVGSLFRSLLNDGLTFDEVLEQKLGVMDLTAIALCREHNVPLQVFDMTKPNALLNVIMGENEGTRVFH